MMNKALLGLIAPPKIEQRKPRQNRNAGIGVDPELFEQLKQKRDQTRLKPGPRPKPQCAAYYIALEDGVSSYESDRPCRHCGGTLRYVKQRQCVACHRASERARQANYRREKGIRERISRNSEVGRAAGRVRAPRRTDAEARDEAKLQGLRRYDGRPCDQCGGTLRYVRDYRCVACTRLDDNKRKARRRQLTLDMRKLKPAPREQEVGYLLALADRQVTYYAVHACGRCGSHERFTASRACVSCHRISARERARRLRRERGIPERCLAKADPVRRAAMEAGQVFYTGAPCPRCGGTERSTYDGRCRACNIAKRKAYHEKKRNGT